MITLYYIKGITAVDEPCCTSLENQTAFFSKYKVQDVDAGFYPPHYRNEITLSNDDINFASTINYLSLDFNDKKYYYFIDDIEYISENVIKLYITMDTIQTYMFNINFLQSDINRMPINRWESIGYKQMGFNRDYIRSNRSKGTMESYYYHRFQDEDIGWYIITINLASTLWVGEESSRSPYGNARRCGLSYSPMNTVPVTPLLTLIAVPISIQQGYNTLVYGEKEHSKYSAVINLRMFGGIDGIESITYYNYNIFKGYVNTTKSDGKITLSIAEPANMSLFHFWRYDGDNQYADLGYCFSPYDLLTIPSGKKVLDQLPSFEQSLSKTNIFDVRFVPALFDENYVQIEFGERVGFTTYPLHMAQTSDLYGCYIINFIDGGRTYYISPNDSTDDFHTLITNTTIEQVALYNSAWQSYLSQNMCTLMRGRALAYQQIGYQSVNNALKGYDGDPRLVTSSYELPYKIHKKYTRHNRDITMSSLTMNYNTDLWARYASMPGDIGNRISLYEQSRTMQEANMKMAPDSQKVGNSCASDITSGVLDMYYRVSKVTDFDDVARDYEQNGYDVAIHTADNLFDYKIRYYYNIIRTDNVEFTLSGVIGDNATINAIKQRFNSGLRLWVVDGSDLHAAYIGDYTYDNVETTNVS